MNFVFLINLSLLLLTWRLKTAIRAKRKVEFQIKKNCKSKFVTRSQERPGVVDKKQKGEAFMMYILRAM